MKSKNDKNRPGYKACAERCDRRQRLKKLGWTEERYDTAFKEQGGVCAICGEPPKQRNLDADHDHDKNIPRGLLCSGCNKGIGHFKENRLRLFSAMLYLQKWGK